MSAFASISMCLGRLLGVAVGVALVVGCSMGARQDEIAEAVSKEMSCPEPSKKEYRAWGKNGISVGCRIDHGPFVAIEGYLRIRGQYEDGRKAGRWTFYDQDGKAYKEVDYSEGEELPPPADESKGITGSD